MIIASAAPDLVTLQTDFFAVGVKADETMGAVNPELNPDLASLDRGMNGALFELLTRKGFTGKLGHTLGFETLGLLPAKRVYLFGLGAGGATAALLRTFAARSATNANAEKAHTMLVAIPGRMEPTQARAISEGLVLGSYRFTKYQTGERKPKNEIVVARLATAQSDAETNQAIATGQITADCICHARDLANEPANELTPAKLSEYARTIADKYSLSCTVFDRQEIERIGMNLIIAVGQGSSNEPRVIHIAYRPKTKSEKKFVIVGKGLTFDSGGLCAKTQTGMADMKSDMAGAANVIAFMEAVAIIKPEIEVHGLIGAAENMPSGSAYRPGDIYRSFDGKTVEIINTDAEGRLVLADILAYATVLEPTVILSNATLTGACTVALGPRCAGYFSTSLEHTLKFEQAIHETREQFWRLPLLDDMKERLTSPVADIKHTGERYGGAVSAMMFLNEFVGKVPFIHCDIAGTAYAEKAYGIYPKGGTGHGILTFLKYLELICSNDSGEQ